MVHCVLCSKMMTGKFRAATGGKTGKSVVLPEFFGIVCGDGSKPLIGDGPDHL